jgi:hypothetical protein
MIILLKRKNIKDSKKSPVEQGKKPNFKKFQIGDELFK